MKRRHVIITGIVIGIGLVFAWQGLPAFEALGALAFGWFSHSARVLPRVTIAGEGAATGVF